jgi:hypothetical protein
MDQALRDPDQDLAGAGRRQIIDIEEAEKVGRFAAALEEEVSHIGLQESRLAFCSLRVA